MTSARETLALVERALHCIRALDVEAYADLFAPDGVLEFPFAPEGWPARVEGRQAIRERTGANLARMRDAGRRFAEMRSRPIAGADPELAVIELDVTIEAPALGRSARASYVHVYQVRGGLIASLRDYFSPDQIRQVQAMFAR